MDVCGLFIGDTTMSYGTMRSPVYRDYEKFPYGTLEDIKNPTIRDYYSKVQEKCQQKAKEKKEAKEECPFCKEQKKRPLISYLRKREIKKNHDKICEEEHESSDTEENLCCSTTEESGAEKSNATTAAVRVNVQVQSGPSTNLNEHKDEEEKK